MKCPYCYHIETKVIDSRELDDLVRRRRECLKCEKRFTTHEAAELTPLYVIKKDSKKEVFEREKLKLGFLKACEKLPVEQEKIELAVNKIEAKLRSSKSVEISTKSIGNEVMKSLKGLDKIAYLRFVSVYNEFKDVSDFKDEIKKLK